MVRISGSRIALEYQRLVILKCANCEFSIRADRNRVFYAFDQRRSAILLLGGDKTGDDRWYGANVPIADARYDRHIEILVHEGSL